MAEMKPGASVTAAIPHPLLFNAPRTGRRDRLTDVAHNEQNVHVDVMYALPVHAVDVKVMGGPTFFSAEAGLRVGGDDQRDLSVRHRDVRRRDDEAIVEDGGGIQRRRRYLASALVAPGVGGLIRYSRGDVKFDDPASVRQTVKAGGVEVGGGVRSDSDPAIGPLRHDGHPSHLVLLFAFAERPRRRWHALRRFAPTGASRPLHGYRPQRIRVTAGAKALVIFFSLLSVTGCS